MNKATQYYECVLDDTGQLIVGPYTGINKEANPPGLVFRNTGAVVLDATQLKRLSRQIRKRIKELGEAP